ncbi:hypothetical protein J3R80_13545 [Aliiroseovarius sp. Z3]|uniref:calcium-binding protein n=1 Tax=Aliiroseovarius sp. Z3 TaxID=2811402 RepID=UPI0023B230CE|nr:calcium-binding protein [Aliiroseovarius sp. Z3]MDE9451493.1 hypothetical protein [Aliiroseovarius sp. Z3]
MASLVAKVTHASGSLAYVANVSDLELFWSGNNAYLYAATGSGGGATVFDLSETGTCVAVAQIAFPLSVVASPTVQIEVLEVDGATYLLPFGRYDWSLNAITLEAPDRFGEPESFTWGTGGLGNLSALASDTIDGQTHVYAANSQSAGFNHYTISDQNTLELANGFSQPSASNTVDMVDLEIVSADQSNVLLALSQDQQGISSYRLDGNGNPTKADDLSAAEFLPISNPTALATGKVLDKTFAIISSAGTSSLTVVEVGADGSLNPTDHVIDNTWTRFSNATEIASAQVGDSLFVVSGGGDDGLSLFTLLPSGKLVHLDTIWDTHQTALQNVSALEMEYTGGKLQIFATSETERGITQVEYDLSGLGETLCGDGSTKALQGTSADDQIDGGIWSEIISAGAGNDILRDGVGEDILTGGAGADIFVLTADDMLDIVTDFQPGVDKLNLSEFHMLYDASQLQVISRSWGAEIIFRNEITHVHSANGQSLSKSHFTTYDSLYLDRPPNGFQYIPETIVGSEADDILGGDEGIENLFGLGGDDQFHWSLGADVFHGGDGTDTVTYDTASVPVWIDLNNQHATGAADGDVYHSIENIIGTALDDTLIGNSYSNMLVGGHGNDTLDGGLGGDTLDGGAGQDTVTYATAQKAAIVQLGLGYLAGAALGDILINIENIMGTAYQDILEGDDASNTLWGGQGNDNLSGGEGNDMLYGGSGTDTLSGGSGADILDGGVGIDWVDYRAATTQVFLDFASNVTGWGASGDTLISIENAYGSAHNDEIHGDDGANDISGMDGDDTLSGGRGNDFLRGNTGNDYLMGFDGHDRLYGGQGNDLLSGGNGNDVLYGNSGDDTLNGGRGNDILYGSNGNDLMIDSGGRDKYYGGQGLDIVDYSSQNVGIYIDLRSGKGSGAAAGDTYSSVEGVIGGQHNDTIYGNAGNNIISGQNRGDRIYGFQGNDTISGDGGWDRLHGGSGHDVIHGGRGRDTLKGGSGHDILHGGEDADRLYGQSGYDTANYSDATSRVSINLTTNSNKGAAQGDKLFSIEAVVGSDWNDQLIGNNGTNTLRGGRGDDYLRGRGGNDRVYGEQGNDKIIAGAGSDHYNGGSGTDTLYLSHLSSGADVWLSSNKGGGSMQGNKIFQIENIIGTKFSDILYGDEIDNLLRGGRGRDTLKGGAGNDKLYGNLGNDRVYGSNGADLLHGGRGDDVLDGGQGDDIMFGGSGSDTFYFGEGADTIKDFQIALDTLRLNAATWSIDVMDPNALTDIADVRDDGIYLDFGGGHSLFLENLHDLADLQNSVEWY